MTDLTHQIILTGLIGTMTALIGTSAGILLAYTLIGKKDNLKGVILGILGGFMLALVMVDFLPEAFRNGSPVSSVTGLASGILLSYFFNKLLDKAHLDHNDSSESKSLHSSIIMSVGIGLHNIPSGMALGAVFDSSLTSGLLLMAALILHGIPESIALGVFFKESGLKKITVLIISLLISVPMGIGSLIGRAVEKLIPYALSVSIAFAAGLIAYIILSEVLPHANRLCSKKALSWEVAAGLVLGTLFSVILGK
ncbi:MAG TPA: ZIP family metal transporter [Clostridia bacterium]|nr:ZIP family metal transporter [Clostridia bacterium]